VLCLQFNLIIIFKFFFFLLYFFFLFFNRFNMLMFKINFKKYKKKILIYFQVKNILKNNK